MNREHERENENSEREQFISVREAAERGHLSRRSIWKLIEIGALRVVRRPAGLRVTRIPLSEFQRLMSVEPVNVNRDRHGKKLQRTSRQ